MEMGLHLHAQRVGARDVYPACQPMQHATLIREAYLDGGSEGTGHVGSPSGLLHEAGFGPSQERRLSLWKVRDLG
jgi:hypothetical protein